MIKVLDKEFEVYMPEAEIQQVVRRVAAEISNDYRDKNPVLCAVLNGSFMFMSDLVRNLDFDAESCFVKYRSYCGMQSTGKVTADLPFPEKLAGRHVIVVEDIIDTGITMEALLDELRKLNPASIAIASFFFKPGSFQKGYKIDYIGREIPNDFIVGYGLDYNGYGRCYRDIYVVADEK